MRAIRMRVALSALGLIFGFLAIAPRSAAGQQVANEGGAASKSVPARSPATAKPTDTLRPLDPKGLVQLDLEGKRLLVKSRVVLREGLLEMLCCPAQTKEHESILAVDCRAFEIHTGLLALGAKPGTPVQYQPVFKPPTGQPIEIFLQWIDSTGKRQRVRAQDWIRGSIHRMYVASFEKLPKGLILPERSEEMPIRFFPKFKQLTWYGPMSANQRDHLLMLSTDPAYREAIRSFFKQGQNRPLTAGWVFAGSSEYVDPQTHRHSYFAEGGDLICVSNFPDAMLDLSVKSTDKEEKGLLFEPWTERVPPKGTEVTMELVPVFAKPAGK